MRDGLGDDADTYTYLVVGVKNRHTAVDGSQWFTMVENMVCGGDMDCS